MTDYIISSGMSATDAVNGGDTLKVLSGGLSSASMISGGGSETIYLGGGPVSRTS